MPVAGTRGLIGITGATGAVGGRVADQLSQRGTPIRQIVRDPSRLPRRTGADIARIGDYDDAVGMRRALEGVDVLLLVSAGESKDRVAQHAIAIDAAADACVGRIVYTSFIGAAPDATFLLVRDHFATEQHLRAAGVGWTLLRDSIYLDFLPGMADDDGVIRGPAGEGRLAGVARDDVAAAAVAALCDERHAGAAYELTGPESLTLGEVASTLSDTLGRSFSYERETIEQARASRAGVDAPEWMVEAWISTYTAIAAGELDRVTGDVEALTGQRPRSLAEVAFDQRGAAD